METFYYYLFAPLVVLSGLLQATLLPQVHIGRVHPDLVLVLVVCWSMLRGAREGIIWALMGGLVLDLLSAGPFGAFSVSLVAISLLVVVLTASFFRPSLAMSLPLIAVSSLCYYGMALAALLLAGRPLPWAETFVEVVAPATLANAALMLVLFPLVRWLHRSTTHREMVW